jgi:hypothetical protein
MGYINKIRAFDTMDEQMRMALHVRALRYFEEALSTDPCNAVTLRWKADPPHSFSQCALLVFLEIAL